MGTKDIAAATGTVTVNAADNFLWLRIALLAPVATVLPAPAGLPIPAPTLLLPGAVTVQVLYRG